MNIEPGKFYKTRSGNKARIYATDGSLIEQIHGAVFGKDGWWRTGWRAFGYWSENQNDHDIIAEWTDKPEVDWSAMPRWANWVAMDEDESWCWFGSEPYASEMEKAWFSSGCGIIPEDFTPKNFTGDWKDSLVERPKE